MSSALPLLRGHSARVTNALGRSLFQTDAPSLTEKSPASPGGRQGIRPVALALVGTAATGAPEEKLNGGANPSPIGFAFPILRENYE